MKKLLLILLCVPLIGFSSFPVNNIDTLKLSDTIKHQNDTILYDSLEVNHQSEDLLIFTPNQEIKNLNILERFIIMNFRLLGTVILAAVFVFMIYWLVVIHGFVWDENSLYLAIFLLSLPIAGISWIWEVPINDVKSWFFWN